MRAAHAALAAALLVSRTATAQPLGDAARPPVSVQPGACPLLDLGVFRRYLAVELQDLLLPARELRPDAMGVTMDCGPRAVSLRLDDPEASAALDRTVDMGGTPRASRPRLLALVVVEMAFTAWIARGPGRPSAVPATATTPRERPGASVPPAGASRWTHAPAEVQRPWRLGAVASLRVYGAEVAAGGGLRVGREMTTGVAWRLDALAERTTVGAAALVASAGTSVMLHTHVAGAGLWLGPGLRGGTVSADVGGALRPWGGFDLGMGAELALGRVRLALETEIGYGLPWAVTTPVQGVWAAAQLEIAVTW